MFELVANRRGVKGTAASRRLRRTKVVPAILHSTKASGLEASVMLEISHDLLIKGYQREDFGLHPLRLTIQEGEQTRALQVKLTELQTHPYKNIILHADFVPCP